MQRQAGILFGMHPLTLNPEEQEEDPICRPVCPPVSDCTQQGGANASLDSADTVFLDDYNCQMATNEFAKQNGIPQCSSGFKEHTFLVELQRLGKYFAKCLMCTKEFPIDMETKNQLCLGTYVHMSCVLFDGKIHILRYMEDVNKFQETKIQLRKILMSPNMIKSAFNDQWDPAVITGCILKPMKKCRLSDFIPKYD